MKAKVDIEDLKKRIGAIDGSIAKETRPFSLFAGGLPCGAIVEVAGHGKTEFISCFLKENTHLKAAWIEKEMSINPYALWQRGVDIRSILFVECGKDFNWTVQQVLRSQVFAVTITSEVSFTEQELRKFQLMVEKNNAQFFLLSKEPHHSWVPKVQIEVSGTQSHTIRRRGSI